jgi:hypothetical protein
MSEKKVISVIKVGSDYMPPEIDRSPTIVDGVATVHFKSPLTKGERDSLRVCFRNFCTRFQITPSIIIREQTVVIQKAPGNVLQQALEFLEIDRLMQPKPRVAAPQQKHSPIKRKPYRTGLGVMAAQLARIRA